MALCPDQSKVEAITALSPPSNVKELRFFLGMITYCTNFLPNLATITELLRILTKKDVPWVWTRHHQDTFNCLKQLLSSAQALAYFNTKAETQIITDASPHGPGALIAQRQSTDNFQPICYASRALSDVERRYSQIERESLAI